MRVKKGNESLSFQDALAENVKQRKAIGVNSAGEQSLSKLDEESHRVYVEAGMYATNLKNYYQYFNPAQIKIIFLESLSKDLSGTMRSIFSFLGVDENFVVEKTEQQHTFRQGKIKSSGSFLRKINI